MNHGTCPVCGRNADTGPEGTRDAFYVRCPRCGSFILSGTAAAMLPSRLENNSLAAARASHAIRSQTSEDNRLEIYSTHVDEICTKPLPSPKFQLINLRNYLKKQAGDPTLNPVDIRDKDALAAVVGTTDKDALINLLQWASRQGLVTISPDTNTIKLIPRGWKIEAPSSFSLMERTSSDSTLNTRKGHCPQCGPDRYADIVAKHEEQYDSDDMSAIEYYYILRCGGCKAMYVLNVYESSEDIIYEHNPETGQTEAKLKPRVTYWPSPVKRPRPEWLYKLGDPDLRHVLNEVYEAFDADLHVLAAIGTRTALDRAFVLKGAQESSGFFQKLEQLEELKIISNDERELLSTLTDAGSAAAHRGWKLAPKQLMTLLNGMETFLYRVFVVGIEVNAIKEHIPPRQSTERSPNYESAG